MKPPEPVELVNGWVRLEPTTTEHVDALWAAAEPGAEEVFARSSRWYPMRSRSDMAAAVELALREEQAGARICYTVWRVSDDIVVGSTSLLEIRLPHSGLEIGATWVGRDYQRTRTNSAAKLALMSYAFDQLGAERVGFRTDAHNLQPIRAVEGFGAVREGVLRHHMYRPDGTWRDTVYFSVLRDEWPAVRGRLERRLTEAAGPVADPGTHAVASPRRIQLR